DSRCNEYTGHRFAGIGPDGLAVDGNIEGMPTVEGRHAAIAHHGLTIIKLVYYIFGLGGKVQQKRKNSTRIFCRGVPGDMPPSMAPTSPKDCQQQIMGILVL